MEDTSPTQAGPASISLGQASWRTKTAYYLSLKTDMLQVVSAWTQPHPARHPTEWIIFDIHILMFILHFVPSQMSMLTSDFTLFKQCDICNEQGDIQFGIIPLDRGHVVTNKHRALQLRGPEDQPPLLLSKLFCLANASNLNITYKDTT